MGSDRAVAAVLGRLCRAAVRDHRQVVKGIVNHYRTGIACRDLPSESGPWQTVCKRHARFSRDGTWDRLLTRLQVEADAAGELDWQV